MSEIINTYANTYLSSQAPYLKDSSFLKQFDKIRLKQQFVKILVLTFDQVPIQQIHGKVTGGSISLDGSSSMRRTCNISLVIDNDQKISDNIKNLLSINKKIRISIGFTNVTDKYQDYSILWFPQGIFVITSLNITHGGDGISVSLTLHDKMALLNGQCGGILPASTIFHQVEEIDDEGNTYITKPTIHKIIQELVNHFGGEQIGKIIISDIENQAKQVMKWVGSTPLYYYQNIEKGVTTNLFTTSLSRLPNSNYKKQYNYGQDVGYILTDFTYPGELIGNAGDTVVTILDQIKDVLGNYEYFYDINGNFRFQEIKNYLNTSKASKIIEKEFSSQEYLVDFYNNKSIYTFENGEIIQSYSNSPQYQQIKNDFIIWGKKKTLQNQEIPIRYHLAIDNKPSFGETSYKVFFYTDPEDDIKKAKVPEEVKTLPEKGGFNKYYLFNNEIYKWDTVEKNMIKTDYTYKEIKAKDFRTQLYLSGLYHENKGTESNYYFAELKNQWPKLYDIENGKFFDEIIKQPNNADYFLDFISYPAAASQFSVQNVGRRTTTIVDDKINCIFSPQFPNVVLINNSMSNIDDIIENCKRKGQQWSQVDDSVYSMLDAGGGFRSAFDQIKKQLFQYTNYNEQISLTTLPIYYLEPNTRISVYDQESGIYGDYIIKNISFSLDINGTMSLSCSKAIERS